MCAVGVEGGRLTCVIIMWAIDVWDIAMWQHKIFNSQFKFAFIKNEKQLRTALQSIRIAWTKRVGVRGRDGAAHTYIGDD